MAFQTPFRSKACVASTKKEWRLKRHLPLEGYTFISAPWEFSILKIEFELQFSLFTVQVVRSQFLSSNSVQDLFNRKSEDSMFYGLKGFFIQMKDPDEIPSVVRSGLWSP